MRFSTSWLGDYVELPDSADRLQHLLSMLGLVVDDVDGHGDEVVYDLDVPSNRPDVMNHVGVAREIAAARQGDLRLPEASVPEAGDPADSLAGVDVENLEDCPRYMARVVTGVRVRPSPGWLTDRLLAIGVRPVNNVVDVTNFVLWELGHPLHAFDLDRLEGNRVVVRRARRGESLITLDGMDRRLQPEDLVIADGDRPVALAGVMGGADSETDAGAERILLEGALFDPLVVRRTATRHDLRTDASHRFERGLSFDGMVAALDRAAALVAELTGGEVAAGRIDVAGTHPDPVVVDLRPARASRVLGVEVSASRCREILDRLGFRLEGDDERLRVTVPAVRRDVAGEHDLIEEVARHHGYDRLPSTLPVIRQPDAGVDRPAAAERTLKELCHACGMWEAMSYAFTAADDQRIFGGPESPPRLANPLSATSDTLRTWLAPGLVRALAHNHRHRRERAALFELGRCFRPSDEGVAERRHLALAAYGPASPPTWSEDSRAVDLFDLKGIQEAVWDRMGWPLPEWRPAELPGLQAGSAAELVDDSGARRGWAGRIDPEAASHFELDVPGWVLEADIEDLLARPRPEHELLPLARYPSSDRDLSVLVPEGVAYRDLAEEVASRNDLPVADFELLDVYEGDDVPSDHRALTLRLVYRAGDRTLTAEEVEEAHTSLIHHLEERLAVRRR